MPWLMPWARPKNDLALGNTGTVVSNILATIGQPKTWTVMVRLHQTGNASSLEGFDCDMPSFVRSGSEDSQ